MADEKETQNNIELMFIVQAALAAKPELLNYYPQAMGLIETLEQKVAEFFGDNEKMLVATRINGVTRLIVLDPKVSYRFTNKMQLEADGDKTPLIANYELSEYKAKLLNSLPVQMIKERYEKLHPEYQQQQSTQPQQDFNPSELLTLIKNDDPQPAQDPIIDSLP